MQTESLEILSLEVTTRCNQACTNCFALAATEQGEMDPVLAKEILREGRAAGFSMLHITGGEPLMWRPLFDLLDFAVAAGYTSVLINTNGTLLNAVSGERLGSYADRNMPVRLSVSLNGPRELHERIRGSGSHRKTIEGIETALKFQLPVEIFTTVDRPLLDRLPFFVEEVMKRFGQGGGITGISLIQLHRTTDDLPDLTREMLTPEDFIILVKMAALLSLQGYPVSILDHALANVVAHQVGFRWLPPSRELSRYGKPILLCTGDLTAHHSSRRSSGRYEPGALGRMLASSGYLVETGPDQATCPACPFVDRCRSRGMTRPSEWLYNNVKDPDPPFCRLALEFLE